MTLRHVAYLGLPADGEIENKINGEDFAICQQQPGLIVRYAYFAAWEGQLSVSDEALLRQILQASDNFCDETLDAAIIIPNPGVLSPWASKAGDILRRCHLNGLRHVERGLFIGDISGQFNPDVIADRMTQTVLRTPRLREWRRLFAVHSPRSSRTFATTDTALWAADAELGLSLSAEDVAHLRAVYVRLKREATEAELLMFAQANSEHCRHKVFNAAWEDGGESLMQSIRRTHAASPEGVITAFADNAAVVKAAAGEDFAPATDGVYAAGSGGLLLVAKAETHNHPTAISPFAGAATGSGGEIRDEAAAGRGATARAGFSGFTVSHLGLSQCGTMQRRETPAHIASPLQIMIDGPLGAATFCNEFGRPSLGGFFRSFESDENAIDERRFGFHKPVMLAGGLGHMLSTSAGKHSIPVGAKIIQLGGPGFRIGMGGGAASSRADGGSELDYDSVQRDNADMQRRAQEVIDACRRPPHDGLILSLHDVGAGGLSNAVIELVNDAARGAQINLSEILVEDRSLSPAEIWCNESQERYVLAVMPESVDEFSAICRREACPFAVIGEATEVRRIVVMGAVEVVVDLPLADVLGGVESPPKRVVVADTRPLAVLPVCGIALRDAAYQVLRHPTVACKRFLINIGDRSVGGMTARDQMVGPWQIPVADCAAFFNDYEHPGGAVFALGERPNVAASAPDSGVRMAVAEALTNLASVGIDDLRQVKLSLNWMANCADELRTTELRTTVRAAADFCESLGVGVIVGKDSLSMRMGSGDTTVESPVMAVATAFVSHENVRRVLTPQLSGRSDTFLMLAAPGELRRLGGSILQQTSATVFADAVPDVEPTILAAFLRAVAVCHQKELLLAYHDRSDGGLWACACEMAFAANRGLMLIADGLRGPASQTDGGDVTVVGGGEVETFFNEEIGVLLEVPRECAADVLQAFADAGLPNAVQTVGYTVADKRVRVYCGGRKLLDEALSDLRQAWDETSYAIARRRDDADCATTEHQRDFDEDTGLFCRLPFTWNGDVQAPAIIGKRPRVAILREQGTNGQREMAAAFTRAGFDAVDLPMGDLRAGRQLDESFQGLAFCGGFSFGDVLGAGRGWSGGILHNAALAKMFSDFFSRSDTFTLGVCNDCQVLAGLQPLMQDASNWRFPQFERNRSKRFESRLVMVEVLPSPSPLLAGMEGAMLPVVSSHVEGRAAFASSPANIKNACAALRFVDNRGEATETYPLNPNGSAGGMTGFCSPDGRVTVMMPHPERVFRCGQLSWSPPEWKGEFSPWLNIFLNARRFVH
jgi:phosphoribosylformylglycinamidine synthase